MSKLPCALCDQCPLKDSGPALSIEGSTNPDVIVVGDGPTKWEVAKGRGFSDVSGSLLRQNLNQQGVTQVAMTHVVACVAPGGSIPQAAVDACAPRLANELSQHNGAVIVAVGALPNMTLIGKKVTDMNACWTETEYGPVLSVLSPGVYLINPQGFRQWLYAMSKLRNVTYLHKPQVAYTLVDSMTDYQAMCRVLAGSPRIVMDLETTGLSERLHTLTAIALSNGTATYVITRDLLEQDNFKLAFADQIKLWNTDGVLRNHNMKFDAKWIRHHFGVWPEWSDDTMLRHYAINEEGMGKASGDFTDAASRGHGLKLLAKLYLNFGEYRYVGPWNPNDAPRNEQSRLWDELYQYAAIDAAATYQLEEKLREMGDERVDMLTNFLVEASRTLARMEYGGVRFDIAYAQVLEATLIAEEESLITQMEELVSPGMRLKADQVAQMYEAYRKNRKLPKVLKKDVTEAEARVFNPRSPQQVADALYREYGLPIQLSTNVHGEEVETTNAAALQQLAFDNRSNPLLPLLIRYRKVQKFRSTYVTALIGKAIQHEDGEYYIHGSFNLHTVVTGRLSSSDPNLQNIPSRGREAKQVKRMFLPDPGHVWLEIDYSQNELRVFASLSEDPTMVAAFREGVDIHDNTAKAIFGENFTDDERRRAKVGNFGILYGMSPSTLSDTLWQWMTDEEKEALIDEMGSKGRALGEMEQRGLQLYHGWMQAYPAVADWMTREISQAFSEGELLSPYHRRRGIYLKPSDRKAYEDLARHIRNCRIQGIASDLNTEAAIQISNMLRTSEIEARLLILVHDSIQFSVHPDHVQALLNKVIPIMEAIPQQRLGGVVPFKVDAKLGPNWGELQKGVQDVRKEEE